MATRARERAPDVAGAKQHLREASRALDDAADCLTEHVRYDRERLKVDRAFRLVHDAFVDLDERESDGELIGERHE